MLYEISHEGVRYVAGRGNMTDAVLERCQGLTEVKGTVHSFLALKGGSPVGWVRVLSDDVLCAWISEVQVVPEWRGQGIGKALMSMVNARFRHTPLWARSREHLVSFFVACGLKPKAKLKPCMRFGQTAMSRGEFPMDKPDQDINYTMDTERLDIKSLGGLFEAVGFGTIENYDNCAMSLEKLFGPGVFGFMAFDKDRLIGLARVLSDEVLCSWVSEVCVHPEYQGQGVGNALLEMVNARFADTALYADAFKGQEPFFVKNGINPQSRVVACGRAPLKA